MKLWLLRPRGDLPKGEIKRAPGVSYRQHFEMQAEVNPWEPWYDKAFGFVVRAESEARARELASKEASGVGPKPWLSEDYSTCVELTGDGPEGVVITDFAAA